MRLVHSMGLALLVAAALAGCGWSVPVDGTPARYQLGGLSKPPNAAAIDRLLWVPGLDDYFIPQGLAVAGTDLLVSGYVSRGLTQNKGQCRVYRVDVTTGATRGQVEFAFPYADGDAYNARQGWRQHCGHAGGLAVAGDRLVVTDTNLLFVTSLAAFAGAPILPASPLEDAPARPFRGGLATADPEGVWIGALMPDESAALFRFDPAAFVPGHTVTPRDRIGCVPLPSHAQGAAIDRDGTIWIARSDLDWGKLDHVDATGRLLARYEIPAGTEGIAFDDTGRLWGVSEAGVRRFDDHWLLRLIYPVYRLFVPFHPVIFALDPSRLQGERFTPRDGPPDPRCR